LDVFFKDYAKWINADQDRSEMGKIEQQLGSFSPEVSPARRG
jgi:hypothetical protein